MNLEECRSFFTPSLWATFIAGLMCAELAHHAFRGVGALKVRRRVIESSAPTDEIPVVQLGQNAPMPTEERITGSHGGGSPG